MRAAPKKPEVWLTVSAISDAIEADPKDALNRVRDWPKRVSNVKGARFEYLCPQGWGAQLRQEISQIKRRPGRSAAPAAEAKPAPKPEKTREQIIEDGAAIITALSRARRYDPEALPKDETGRIDFTLLKEIIIQRLMANKQHFAYAIGCLTNFPEEDREQLLYELNAEATKRNKQLFSQGPSLYSPLRRRA